MSTKVTQSDLPKCVDSPPGWWQDDISHFVLNHNRYPILEVSKKPDDWLWVCLYLRTTYVDPAVWDVIKGGYFKCDQLSDLIELLQRSSTTNIYKICRNKR